MCKITRKVCIFQLYFFHVPPPAAAVTTPAPVPTARPPSIPEKLKDSAAGLNSPITSASKLGIQNAQPVNVPQNAGMANANQAVGNDNRNPVLPQGPVNNVSGTDNKGGEGLNKVGGAIQQPTKLVGDDKVRTKLDTNNIKTNVETKKEINDVKERKVRSKKIRNIRNRKSLKERQLA